MHTVAPRSISASRRSRPRSAPPIDTATVSASRSESALAANALAHAPNVHLDADDVDVVDLGRDRRRRVAADARAVRRDRRASRWPRCDRRLPTADGRDAGSRAGPTLRSPRPVPPTAAASTVGNRAMNAGYAASTRATCVWCSITSETSTAQRSRVARQMRSCRPLVRYQRASGASRTRRRGRAHRRRRADRQHDGRLRLDRGARVGFWSMTLPTLPGVDACSIVCTTNPCASRSSVARRFRLPDFLRHGHGRRARRHVDLDHRVLRDARRPWPDRCASPDPSESCCSVSCSGAKLKNPVAVSSERAWSRVSPETSGTVACAGPVDTINVTVEFDRRARSRCGPAVDDEILRRRCRSPCPRWRRRTRGA